MCESYIVVHGTKGECQVPVKDVSFAAMVTCWLCRLGRLGYVGFAAITTVSNEPQRHATASLQPAKNSKRRDQRELITAAHA